MIYPEGTWHRSDYLCKFRPGAFRALKPVQPVMQEIESHSIVSAANADLTLPVWGVLMFCSASIFPRFEIKLKVCPPFEPTDYMWEHFSHISEKKEEVYAHCVRELFQSCLKLKKGTQSNRTKVAYNKFLWGKTDECTINGKTWNWPLN